MSYVSAISQGVVKVAKTPVRVSNLATATASGLASYACSGETMATLAGQSSYLTPILTPVADFLKRHLIGLTGLGTFGTFGAIGTYGFGVTAAESLIGAFTRSGKGPISRSFSYLFGKGRQAVEAAKQGFKAAA